MATEPTNIRLDSEAKEQAFAIFEQIGIKPAQAINLFLRQVALRGGLPFELTIPNYETLETFKKTDAGQELTRHKSVDSFFNSLKKG